MSAPRPPTTLFLVLCWMILGPGTLMPLFWLAPSFWDFSYQPSIAVFRVVASLAYFALAATVLFRLTRRYLRAGPPPPP